VSSGPLALTFFNPYVESVTMTGCIFAIAGIGLFITIASGQFSIAHAALMGLGGYAAALASTTWGELSFWLATLFGALVGGVSGVILALLLRRMGGMLLAVATLAIGVALSVIVSNIDYLGG
jgi:branched-chain amino acid transport system permease protein